ncbi:MAG: penicillin-binding transpeptidase domain-containing protein [Oscillospiraceae bacterium]|nr:penicillin-binding transpeptidase domain-containing protein [Oscillospiraceae bacterium]
MEREQRTFSLRVIICFFLIMLGFLSCILRIFVISTKEDYKNAATKQSSKRIEIVKLRGTIFDCNRIPITNAESKLVAAVIPGVYSEINLKNSVDKARKADIEKLIRQGEPFVTAVDKEIKTETVATARVYRHTLKNMPAAHLIGYTDSSMHGVSGLEKAYDELLYSEKSVSAVFKTDGRGGLLYGGGVEIENDTSVIANGVVSTIDINIQIKAEEIAKKIEKGAIVVADAKTSKIRAMVSIPTFDVCSVEDFLNAKNSPLINRCISGYNLGSAFKPCVAAAALSANYGYNIVNCKGYLEIDDRRFNCHERSGHGKMNLLKGLMYSCNVFFYDTAIKLGGDRVYNMASSLGFGNKIKLAENYYTAKGNLSEKSDLKNNSELANLSIGQGKLIISPVSLLTLYSAIAGDGSYILPSVTEGVLKDGSFKASETSNPTQVMSKETAKKLRGYLKEVVESGTGVSAKPKTTTAAGKTATAQTGRYLNGVEITHSWFCGFFPAEKPRYTVIVMVEGGTGSANIFAQIADAVTEIYPEKNEDN